MAATRLIAMHVNKDCNKAQCLQARINYAANPSKTEDGELVTSYECDPKTAAEEFLLLYREYEQTTGKTSKNDVIAYQIRQSFKTGEVTPEEANVFGQKLAMRCIFGEAAANQGNGSRLISRFLGVWGCAPTSKNPLL